MTIVQNEIIALVPLFLISIVYLGRDVFMFNRFETTEGRCIRFTRTQLIVSTILYPIWVFLVWVENLSQKRKDYYVVVLLNIVNTILGWWTTVAVFNDSFTNTKQQKISLIFSFLLSGLWRIMNVLVFD